MRSSQKRASKADKISSCFAKYDKLVTLDVVNNIFRGKFGVESHSNISKKRLNRFRSFVSFQDLQIVNVAIKARDADFSCKQKFRVIFELNFVWKVGVGVDGELV